MYVFFFPTTSPKYREINLQETKKKKLIERCHFNHFISHLLLHNLSTDFGFMSRYETIVNFNIFFTF